jgi:hypothetical protein
MTGLEYLLVFAAVCTVAWVAEAVLVLWSEPPAAPQRIVPLAELMQYQPRHAAPTPASPFAAWRDR